MTVLVAFISAPCAVSVSGLLFFFFCAPFLRPLEQRDLVPVQTLRTTGPGGLEWDGLQRAAPPRDPRTHSSVWCTCVLLAQTLSIAATSTSFLYSARPLGEALCNDVTLGPH